MKVIISKNGLMSQLRNGYYSFLVALVTLIILPIHIHYLPPFMALWCIAWILENYSRFGYAFYYRKEFSLLFILFVSYYTWETIGLLYTTDMKMGLSNLFGRLSLILFPLTLFYPGKKIKNNVKLLTKMFALSTLIFMLYCFGNALFRSVNLQDGLWTFNPHPPEYFWLNYFYASDLTGSQHPSYVSMYVILSTFVCFEAWFDYSLKFLNRIVWLMIGFVLLIFQYFLSSRAGILISLVLVPLYFIVKFRDLGKKRFAWVWIILLLIALLPLIVKNQRVEYLYGRIVNKQVGYERKKDPRFLIWESSLKLARKNLFFGVGIGDVRTELALEYKRIGEEKMAQERLNAHNQFLEILLENGIIGLILFGAIFAVMGYIALSERNLLYGMFIIIMLGFFMFETILYRLAGVSFFSIFSFLLLNSNTADKKLKSPKII